MCVKLDKELSHHTEDDTSSKDSMDTLSCHSLSTDLPSPLCSRRPKSWSPDDNVVRLLFSPTQGKLSFYFKDKIFFEHFSKYTVNFNDFLIKWLKIILFLMFIIFI